MERKKFVTGLLASAGAMLTSSAQPHTPGNIPDLMYAPPFRIPPYLKPGDTIGITSPAGYITLEDIQPALRQLEQWGYKTRIGTTIGKKDFTFGGTDDERTADFQQLLDDKTVNAILCARGGYGMGRIIDRLNFKKFMTAPKWIIGFSDITVIHSHLSRNYQVASLHSKMCNSFPKDPALAEPIQTATILSIQKALAGEPMRYEAPFNLANRTGSAKALLKGGNLKMLESLAGTPSDIQTQKTILFVEDTGEYLYSIDRMFWNLKRSGKLQWLAGLIIGGFKIKPDEPGEEFGRSLMDIVREVTKEYRYPIAFDFPTGHQKNNMALKCGVLHRLSVTEKGTTLESL
jgi:muramoyltetrapeptide carboxypeptidase